MNRIHTKFESFLESQKQSESVSRLKTRISKLSAKPGDLAEGVRIYEQLRRFRSLNESSVNEGVIDYLKSKMSSVYSKLFGGKNAEQLNRDPKAKEEAKKVLNTIKSEDGGMSGKSLRKKLMELVRKGLITVAFAVVCLFCSGTVSAQSIDQVEEDFRQEYSQKDPNTQSDEARERNWREIGMEDSDVEMEKSGDRAYVVKPGETIYSIAKKLNLSVDLFMGTYGVGIEDPNNVKAGTEIYLPGHIAAELEESGEMEKSTDRAYKVKQGETIYSIANKLDMSVEEFIDLYAPDISDPSNVRAGTEIYLPGHLASVLER